MAPQHNTSDYRARKYHPCGVCIDDGRPHRIGVQCAAAFLASYVDPRAIAQEERRRRWVQIHAARREQARGRRRAA